MKLSYMLVLPACKYKGGKTITFSLGNLEQSKIQYLFDVQNVLPCQGYKSENLFFFPCIYVHLFIMCKNMYISFVATS